MLRSISRNSCDSIKVVGVAGSKSQMRRQGLDDGTVQRYGIIRNFFASQSLSRQRSEMTRSRRYRQIQSAPPLPSSIVRTSDTFEHRRFYSSQNDRDGKQKRDAEVQDATQDSKNLKSQSEPDSTQTTGSNSTETTREVQDQSLNRIRGEKEKEKEGDRDRDRFSPDEPYHNYPRSLRELALRAFNSNPNARSNPSLQSSKDSAFQSHSQSQSTSQDHSSSSSDSTSSTSTPSTSTSAWARPTKEDLLKLAHGFWTRARIRFKWFTIRGFRRFNVDDLSAFFTLGGLGTILFIVIGTTTAVSVVFAGLNLLNMQEWIARKLADYLTAETGVTVVFESAIVPKWKDSRISFKNVFISRRAHGGDIDSLLKERKALARKKNSLNNSSSPDLSNVTSNPDSSSSNHGSRWWSISNLWHRQDSQEAEGSEASTPRKRDRRKRNWRTAATAGQGMAWEGTHYEEDEEVAPPMSPDSMGRFDEVANGYDDDPDSTTQVNNNFTMFDLNVDSIDVTLSFKRWWNGMGIIEDAVVKGVRGIVDRRNVFWDPSKPYDPRAHRRSPRHGDFHLESLVVEDFLVTVYQPGDFRPFNFSIFQASIPRLRKQWLFYDLLSANSITGQVDGCLMSLHKPQTIGRTIEAEQEREAQRGSRWKTMSRFRVDGVNIDHIQNQSDLTGPLSWILSSRFDVVMDIKFPKELEDDVDINTIISEIVENLTIAVSGDPFPLTQDEDDEGPIPGQSRLSGPAIEAPVTTVGPGADRAREAKLKQKELEGQKLGDENDWREQRRIRWRDRMRKIRERRNGAVSPSDDEKEETENREGGGNRSAEIEAQSEEDSIAEKKAMTIPTPSVVIDMDVRFKDTKAAVPLFTRDISYKNNAFVRPIVAFMNAHKTLIPVHCRIVMDLSEFDGSTDLGQTGLLPLVSEKIHEALANHVASQNANQQRLKNVSLWSLQKVANAAARFLRNNIQNQNNAASASA